jgi:hypothetical protein
MANAAGKRPRICISASIAPVEPPTAITPVGTVFLGFVLQAGLVDRHRPSKAKPPLWPARQDFFSPNFFA